jgi:hypothetical protein
MNSWLQPWTGENGNCLPDFDTQMLAQSMQLEDLLGQDQLNFSDDASLNLSAPTSSASSPSESSAQISPIVQAATDNYVEPLQENLIVERLQELENDVEEEILEVEEEQIEMSASTLKRRRNSSSSEDSSDDSSSSEESDSEDDEDIVIPTTVANMSSRGRVNYSSDSDSDSDMEAVSGRRSRASSPLTNAYVYMHKRQIEETLLDRITNQLDPEKLPGILPILSSEKANNQQEDEVEIDLSCLAREQLVQVLSYVDACILEQNGGPTVNVERYIKKQSTKKGPRTRPALIEDDDDDSLIPSKKTNNRRRPRKPKTKTRAELTEDIDAGSSSDEDSLHYEPLARSKSAGGPMSMASLSKKNNTLPPTKSSKAVKRSPGKKSRNNRRKTIDDDSVVSSSVAVFQDPDSIASSRPKRRAAVHKRRLLEEMLAPSDNESGEDDEDEDDSPIVVYGEEKMDFGVVDNQTIMHQSSLPVQVISEVVNTSMTDNEDTDEEIDILC